MGVSTTPAELAGKLFRLSRSIERASAVGVTRAALHVKVSVGLASGPYNSSRLTNVSFVVTPGANPSALVKMTNRKAHLLDHDTKSHSIQPKARRGRQALNIPGVGPRASAKHPGTKGKFMWEKGVAAAEVETMAKFGSGITDAMLGIFG